MRDIVFGDLVLKRARGCLVDQTGGERFLRPKSYRVLEVLLERRGQLVGKDELVREVWPDAVASDDSLAQCISDIRRVIGPAGAGLLRTVPRRGYMVAEAQDARPSIALRKGRALPLTAVVKLAMALLVAAIALWWASPRDAVQVVTDEADQTVREANALLQARDWRRREDNERARDLLEVVLADNSEHAGAWASLGLTYWLEVSHLAWGGGRREMATALEMVERAVALGGSAGSNRLLAEMRLLAPFPEMRSPVDALASARAAVTIDPVDPDNLAVLAYAFALTGRPDESVTTIERALRLDPTPPEWYRLVAGLSYLLAGKPARAVEEFGPLYGAGTFSSSRWWPGWLFAASLAHAGRIEEAATIIESARRQQSAQNIQGVIQSLDGFADGRGLAVIAEGLRIAGMPG